MTRLGPVAPRRTDTCALLPLGLDEVTLGPGFWGDRQVRNRTVTLPHIRQWLEKAGTFANLRAVAARDTAAAHRGMLFADSDAYKWLEALGWTGSAPADVIGVLAAAQDSDGYLNTHYQLGTPGRRWTDLAFGHELYCLGHLIQAAVAQVRGAGDTALLEVACRFADLAGDVFAEDGLCGHPEVETALVELYRVTGEDRYLALAGTFLDRRGHGFLGPGRFGPAYYQDHMPVRAAGTMSGHAVRALYLATGMIDVYAETGDRSLLEAAVTQWDAALAAKTYVTGGQGSRHVDESFGDEYELPPDRAYAETCAGIASVMLAWRLLLITGHGRYADAMERALFNVVAASTSDDGRHFFYVNTLQRRGPGPGRPEWFDCACCPPNLARLLASLQAYFASTGADGVQLHQYASGTVAATLAGGRRVAFAVDTDYPSSGRITVRITGTDGGAWRLALRVPQWSAQTTVTIDGTARAAAPDDRGYAVVERDWRPGDSVTLDLDMTPRMVRPHPRIDAVRGSVAFLRGPLVYCFEQIDQPAGADLADVAVDARGVPHVAGDVLEVPGIQRTPAAWGGSLYRDDDPAPEPGRQVTLIATPYHRWANRTVDAMRIWVPLEHRAEAGA